MTRESEIADNMGSVCEDCALQSQQLLKAADYGHEECVLSLIKAGADVNERDSFHHTALIKATETGLEKCTITLKDMCRQTIRNRLIELDPKHHLFQRIPLLKLPNILRRYLLYNMSLETSKKTVDADDGGSTQAAVTDENGKGKTEKKNGSA